jgi:O-antigen/teichoic acid export membrane protein
LSLLLVPRFGAIGAAWSNTLAYAVLAGAAMLFSQRVYPLAYDWSRLARVIGAAAVSAVAGRLVLSPAVSPWLGLPVRGIVVVVIFAGLLGVSRFFEPREIRQLRLVWGRLRSGAAWRSRTPEEPR